MRWLGSSSFQLFQLVGVTIALVALVALPVGAAAQEVDLLRAVGTDLAVSSTYRNQRTQLDALIDGDLETAWNSRSGDLTTSWIEVRVPASASVTGIAMTVGFTHTTERGVDLFLGNHRVRRVRVLRDGAQIGEHALDVATRTLQTIPVRGPGGVYRIEILETEPGARSDWREVCISELRVMGTDPGARPGLRIPRVAVGSLPPPRARAPPDREALLGAHRQRVAAFERSWLLVEQSAESPRVGSAPDEELWPSDMQELVRTRRAALTALADYIAPADEIEADALRVRAAARVPLEWSDRERERVLAADLEAIAHAMDGLHAFLADDAAQCRWARALGHVHITRAATMARGDASFADQEHSEAMDTNTPLTERARQGDALARLAEALTEAEQDWSRNTRGVAARLRRLTPPAVAAAAPDLARVVALLEVAQRTCGW